MSDTVRVGFVGTGRMATALAGGLVSSEFCSRDSIVGNDVVPAAAAAFAEATGGSIVDSNAEVANRSDVIVLAVKPQQISEVLAELASAVTPDHLVVSIAAGITLSTLADALGSSTRLVRVMPNTPGGWKPSLSRCPSRNNSSMPSPVSPDRARRISTR